MGSPNFYARSGGTVGARLATRYPILSSGKRRYLCSVNGSDAATGLDRQKPFATLSAAYTASSAGDTLVILEEHEETLTAAQTLGKAGLLVLGEGSGSSSPRFTCNGTIAMFDVTAAGVVIENIYFPASTAVPTARVRIATVGCQVVSCTFDCGASDTAASLKFVTGAGQCFVGGTVFNSTATSLTAQPAIGIEVANAMSDLELDTVVFEGGDVGWSDFAFKGTAAITRLTAIDIDTLNDSDGYVATGSIYSINPRNVTGSSRWEITA